MAAAASALLHRLEHVTAAGTTLAVVVPEWVYAALLALLLVRQNGIEAAPVVVAREA